MKGLVAYVMEGFDYEEGQPIEDTFDELYPREYKENRLFLPNSIAFRHPPMMSYVGSNVVPTFAQYSSLLNAKDLDELKHYASGILGEPIENIFYFSYFFLENLLPQLHAFLDFTSNYAGRKSPSLVLTGRRGMLVVSLTIFIGKKFRLRGLDLSIFSHAVVLQACCTPQSFIQSF